ncbi:MBL fold metallo-hydrolase RNA specificity domain-containing protein [Chryseosolibacter indicus]|uniref:MBL fold metallo-hydrolase n=1 Tax=Chryseosolibacter indicus TaxID=2782351 RepID=A0ABS5VPM6_9BACT|nr:MBL fold metallo-hydrolase [Chryseosolibacter indicus]MBT1703390.1 MBL fold metallo-hydrolase [Chryseosolibacter indicus]
MELSFYGAAQSVTGSKHLITLGNGRRILLDCGMVQGKNGNNEDLNASFLFKPETVDYLILSHAHIDHCGLIPRLVKKGFKGKIFSTPPTLELCKILLNDSANIQEAEVRRSDTKTEPLYGKDDVDTAFSLFTTVEYDKPYTIDDSIELLFTDAGHILGSAVVNLTIKENGKERHIAFTGDIGRYCNRILKSPQAFPQADVIICESTYGDKLHETIDNSEEKLLRMVNYTCVEKKGNLLIPAFSIGRTQELIFSLNKLAEDNRLPDVDVFIDSPMSVYATDVMRDNKQYFSDSMQEYLKFDSDPFGFDRLHYIVDHNDSAELQKLDKPCVIIAASGMMEGGRIVHHLKNNISDPKNTILVTGYCEPATLGGKISHGAEEVVIMDETLPVKAEVIFMNEYSAHADYGDLLKLLMRQDKEQIKKIFLVHGEKRTMVSFKDILEEYGFKNVEMAEYRMSYEV